MSIKGQLSEQDFIDFQELNLKQPKIFSCCMIYIYFIFFLIIISIIFSGYRDINNYLYLFPIAFIIILFSLFRYVLMPNNWKKLFAQNKELNLPFEVELNEDAIIFTTELSTSKRPWKNFIKWKYDKKLILLYHADNMATMLPKRIFNEEQINFIYSKLQINNIPKSQVIGKKNKLLYIFSIILIILFLCGYLIISYMSRNN
jgi:hypothetical protein